MTSEASPEPAHRPECPASPQWDNSSASGSDTFSTSASDVSDADSKGISRGWDSALPIGDKQHSQAVLLPEDQYTFVREHLGEERLSKLDSTGSIALACAQETQETLADSSKAIWVAIRALQEQVSRGDAEKTNLSQQLQKEKLEREKLSQELQIAQSTLNLVEAMRSDINLFEDGLEKATLEREELLHNLQAAQQEIETGKSERAQLSRELRTAQDEIVTAEEELGEKEEQVVTIQNLLEEVEVDHFKLVKSVATDFSTLREEMEFMLASLQSKEGFTTEVNKLRLEANELQSELGVMRDSFQLREQNENKRIAAIQSRVDNQEQEITRLHSYDWHHTKAYHEFKDFKDMAVEKIPEIDKLRTEVDANNEGIQSQERTSVKLFKNLQTRLDDHDQTLRRIQQKIPSYATNDQVGRTCNMLATRIDDCASQEALDSKTAATDREIKELAVKVESIPAVSVTSLENEDVAWAMAADLSERLNVVDKKVQAVNRQVDMEAHRIAHVGKQVGAVECQIVEIKSQSNDLQEDNTKLHCTVERQESLLRQVFSQIELTTEGGGTSIVDRPSTTTDTEEFVEMAIAPVIDDLNMILTPRNSPINTPQAAAKTTEIEQTPTEDLFNGRNVKPEGYQTLLNRLPDNIRLIFSLADTDVDPRPTINSLSANHGNIWAGIPSEYRRLVGLVCLRHMALDTKPDEARKHLKWIAEALSAEDWAEYEELINHHASLSLSLKGKSELEGQAEAPAPLLFGSNAIEEEHPAPPVNKGSKPSKAVIEGLKTWLEASKEVFPPTKEEQHPRISSRHKGCMNVLKKKEHAKTLEPAWERFPQLVYATPPVEPRYDIQYCPPTSSEVGGKTLLPFQSRVPNFVIAATCALRKEEEALIRPCWDQRSVGTTATHHDSCHAVFDTVDIPLFEEVATNGNFILLDDLSNFRPDTAANFEISLEEFEMPMNNPTRKEDKERVETNFGDESDTGSVIYSPLEVKKF